MLKSRNSEVHYIMTHGIYQRILTEWSNWKNLKKPKLLLFCGLCDHPIQLGDKVISKRRQRSRVSLFHKKCFQSSFIDYI